MCICKLTLTKPSRHLHSQESHRWKKSASSNDYVMAAMMPTDILPSCVNNNFFKREKCRKNVVFTLALSLKLKAQVLMIRKYNTPVGTSPLSCVLLAISSWRWALTWLLINWLALSGYRSWWAIAIDSQKTTLSVEVETPYPCTYKCM